MYVVTYGGRILIGFRVSGIMDHQVEKILEHETEAGMSSGVIEITCYCLREIGE